MPSALEEYSMNYGAKLRAALSGGGVGSALVADPKAKPGMPNARPNMGDSPLARLPPNDEGTGEGPYVPEEDPIVPVEPGGSADPEGGQDMGGPMAQPMGSELAGDPEPPQSGMQQPDDINGPNSFRTVYKNAPGEVRDREVAKLEEALKRGNQTIDDAYDELEQQMGLKPDKKKKLSKQEKGMILMEFGLNLLANSRKGFGAIGEAGGKALGSYREQTEGPYKDYEATKGVIDAERAKSKVKLAEGSALESVKQSGDKSGRLPGRFTGDDGFVYFYDESGQVQQAKDSAGKPIKGAANENAIRPSEFEVKKKAYMEAHGVGRDGRPLSALEMRRVEKDALDFAGDRGKTLDDLDLDIQAERSADDFIRSNNELFRDMTPDQVNEYRNKLASERRTRLKRPVRSYLDPNEPTRGRPSGRVVRKFSTEQEAREAFKRGEIQVGDRISVNGIEDEVE